ncbi:MAG TPA: MFS transporter [Candidatus Limnocylindrales bacterium]|nr:MFS transporter [Candidatus Limnocylindrales bacterium]
MATISVNPDEKQTASPALPDTDETSVLHVPRIASALRHRDFRLFWTGNFLSNIGTWMEKVATGWLVLQLTNSAFWLGVVGFASSIPILVFALIGGVVADHVNNRKLLMFTQSAMMTFAFALSLLAFFRVINVYEIALLALGTGLAMSLNTPSYQAMVPRLIPRKDLTNAIALNSAQFNMSRVIGPTLGGFAMALFGVAGNFFLNGLSFLAVLFALTRMKIPERQGPPSEGHLWNRLEQGFAYVFSHVHMYPLVLLTAIASLLAVPYLTFVPYFARDVLHSDARGLGLLMACNGVGAFFGAATIAWIGRVRRRGHFVVRAGVGFFTSIMLFTFSTNFLLSGFFLMCAGYFMITMVATVNALLQHLAEDHMRGRVMSIYSTAFLGLPPLGSLTAGLLARVITPAHAIAGMCALAMAGTVVVFAGKRELRELD